MFELVPELPEEPQHVARESELRKAYERGRDAVLLALCIGSAVGLLSGALLGFTIAHWLR